LLDELAEVRNRLIAKGLSERTVSNYLSAVKKFEEVTGKKLSEATPSDIYAFLASLPPPSRYAYGIALRSVLKSLELPTYASIKIARLRLRKYNVIPEDVIEKIVADLSGSDLKLAAAVALTYELGLRVSELANLRLEDLDTQSWTCTVERIKSRRVYRLPIVSDWVKTVLTRYLETHPRHTEYLIYSRKKPYKYRVPALSRLISATLKQYGIDARPHDLRHSRATNLLRKGLDVRALQVFLGHASISQTERYTHLTEVDLRRMIEKLYTSQTS